MITISILSAKTFRCCVRRVKLCGTKFLIILLFLMLHSVFNLLILKYCGIVNVPYFLICVCSHRVTSAGVSRAQTVICCDSPLALVSRGNVAIQPYTDTNSRFYPLLLFISSTLEDPQFHIYYSVTAFILL